MFTTDSKLTIALSAIFFLFGAATFTVQNASALSANAGDNPCYHCGSISACQDGGQDYGYTDCEIDWDEYGSVDGCNASGMYCSEEPIEN